MSSTFKALGAKLNEACVQLVNSNPHCTLCDVKLPNKANYDSHTKGKAHRAKSNDVFKQLMSSVLLPGITMKKHNGAENVTIHCLLCEQQVSDVFDVNFHNHISSFGHQSKVNEQRNLSETKGLYLFYKNRFGRSVEEDVLLKGVSQASIIVGGNDRYRCVPCNRELTGRSQLGAHIKEIPHQEWAFDQISKVADKIGLSLGVIVKGGSLICKLCNCKLGNGLATADAYHHCNASAIDDEHTKKVQEQIENGLYEFYEEKDDDESDLDDMAYIPNSTWGLLNYFDGDLEEYALQALHWDDRDSDEDMLMYMGLNAMNDYYDDSDNSSDYDVDEF